jgi:hypothetical protein
MFFVAEIYDARISRKGTYGGNGDSFPFLYQGLPVLLREECRYHVKRPVLS